jgi:hypothetical protein
MLPWRLTNRLSGKRMRCPETKLLYFHHRFPPTINEDEPRSPLEPLVRLRCPTPAFARRGFSHRCRAPLKSIRMTGTTVAENQANRRSQPTRAPPCQT